MGIVLVVSTRSFGILAALLILTIYLLPDLYLQKGIRIIFPRWSKSLLRIYWPLNLLTLAAICVEMLLMGSRSEEVYRIDLYLNGWFIALMLFKISLTVIMCTEDIFRGFRYGIFRLRHRRKSGSTYVPFSNGRRKFIAQAAMLVAFLPFGDMIYGMIRGKYNFMVREQAVYFPDLPSAFDGLTITQYSDLHIGSFDRDARAHLTHAVDLIKSLHSDLIFFTGDVVNSQAVEMNGWYDVFEGLEAPLGKFAVLGNHDYGDYVNWPSEEAKAENLRQVKNIHPALGFRLLLNEHVPLEKNGEKIYIVGVENWGKPPFPQYGDIAKATQGLGKDDFKILLSHDPNHWEAKVLKEPYPCQLMCAGHTHGFQMGVEVPGIRWSLSQYFYKEWAGLYHKGEKYIYVNRGLGFIGFSGRAGIWPEITRITLRRK